MKTEIGGTTNAPPRETFVGASEIGALFNLDPFKTRWHVWAEKSGKLPVTKPDTALLRVAKRMEDVVADEWAYAHPEGSGYWRNRIWYAHPDWPEVRGGASLDYVARAPGPGPNRRVHKLANRVNAAQAVECKTTSARMRDRWMADEPPIHNQLQVQQQMLCSRYELDTLAYLVDRKYEDYPYEPHPQAQGRITDEIVAFWKSVREGNEPPFDPERDADAFRLARMLGEAPEEIRDGTEDDAQLIREYVEAAAEAKRYEADRKRIASVLHKRAEGAKKVICPDGESFSIVRRKPREAKIVVAEFAGQEIVLRAADPGSEYPGHFRVPKGD